VRVEDNVPAGARFVVELNTLAAADQNGNIDTAELRLA
jgi:hypothetical protein